MYRYYVPIRKVRFGAKATGAGRLPAEAIERLVLAQVHAALQTPEVVQAVCDRVAAAKPKVTEPEVVLALRQLGNVWEQLFPAERQRIVQLLIERVTLLDEGIEITWRDVGWATLVGEMLPGTIGAELAEFEQMQEAWHDADHSDGRSRPAAGREAHDLDSGPHQAKWRAEGGDTGAETRKRSARAPRTDPQRAGTGLPLAAAARRRAG
jgi:hypothetical protein